MKSLHRRLSSAVEIGGPRRPTPSPRRSPGGGHGTSPWSITSGGFRSKIFHRSSWSFRRASYICSSFAHAPAAPPSEFESSPLPSR
eukprot:31071-Pelagococcus_subviridis.AAC.23